MALAKLSIDIEARLANFERDMSKIARTSEESAKKVQNSWKSVGETIGAAIGAFVAVDLVSRFKGIADSMDEMSKAAQTVGLTTERLSELAYAGSLSGVQFEEMTKSLGKLSVKMQEAESGTKTSVDLFNDLGIKVSDASGKLKSSDAVLEEIADKFEKTKDGAAKTSIAIELFGRSGAKLVPLLNGGSAGIGELADEARRLGAVFDGEMSKKAEEFNDNIERLGVVSQSSGRLFANELLPFLVKITNEMTAATSSTGSLSSALGSGLRTVLETVAVIGANTVYVFKGIGTEIGGIAAQAAAFLSGDFKGAASIGKMMKDDAALARKEIDALTERILDRSKATKNAIEQANKSDLVRTKHGISKSSDSNATDYSKLISSLNEKISIQTADLNSVEKLTNAEKEYAKYQADLASGALVLSASQKSVAEAFWSVYQARNKANESEKANEKANALVGDYMRGNALIIERISREEELALMTERQRSIAEAVYRTEDEGSAIRERIIRDIQDETARKIALAKAEEELAIQKEKVADVTARSYDQQQSFSFGWTKAFQSYADSANNAAKQAQDVFARASSAMEDALVNFAMTGKISFSSLATSIIADIVRVNARAATSEIMGAIGKVVGSYFSSGTSSSVAPVASAKGNVFSMPSLSAYSGTVVNQPTFFANGGNVMGEAGPEGIFPLKRGKDGKLGVAAEGSGVTVNVINNSGSQATTSERKDSKGNRIIEVLIEQTKNAIASDISSGNGAIPAAMAGSYGLKRTAGAY